MRKTILKIEDNDVQGSLRTFLGKLLTSKIVDAVLAPKMLPGGDGFVQTLVKDPAMLEGVHPLAPTMAVQSAAILADLTAEPSAGRIAAVLKPCELRAAVELAKFLQINLDNVLTIGVDCFGTVDVKAFSDMTPDERSAAIQAMLDGSGGESVRECCRMCVHPAPTTADVAIGLFGASSTAEIPLLIGERFEKECAEKLELALTDGEPSGREAAVEKIVASRTEERTRVLAELKGRTDSMEKLLGALATCVRCHNCMNACPICYCKECVFNSAVFEHSPDQLLKRAERRGAIRMPSDTLNFHLTRMSHMATSCVSCGMCESACPNQLPIASLFASIGGELQDMFEYVPGRDAEEEPPVSTFKENELETCATKHGS